MRLTFATIAALLFMVSAARAEIVIGVAVPLTGADAPTGEQVRRGAEAAMAEINAMGGVLGQPIKLLMKDDAGDPRQAVAIANQFISGGVKVVVGHVNSGPAIAAAKLYDEEGIIAVSPSATNPKLTEEGFRSIFRVCGRDDQQGAVAADYIAKNFAGKNVAIIHDKTAYAQGLADVVKAQLNKSGVKETLYDTVTRGDRDFSALVSKLKQAKIDIIYYGGYHSEAGLLVRQMRDQKLPTVLIGGDDLITSTFWTITGSAGEGTLLTFVPDPRNNPAAADAVAGIRKTGYEPESYTLFGYAAVQVIVQAIERAGKTESAAMIAAMRADKFDTVLGSFDFDTKGDIKAPAFVMYHWHNGNYVQLP
jgi:branched-chain amino acid transport system substrate-binding protein